MFASQLRTPRPRRFVQTRHQPEMAETERGDGFPISAARTGRQAPPGGDENPNSRTTMTAVEAERRPAAKRFFDLFLNVWNDLMECDLDEPPRKNCPHLHVIDPRIRSACPFSSLKMSVTKCPHESSKVLAKEESFTNYRPPDGLPPKCAVCGLSEEVRFPLLRYCHCATAKRLHPECLSETVLENSNFYHLCLMCNWVFMGTREKHAESRANLTIRVIMAGREVYLKHRFLPEDSYGDVVSLLRRLRFIAHIPTLMRGKAVISSNPGWWDAPLDVFHNDKDIRAIVPCDEYFSVSVFHRLKFRCFKVRGPYSQSRGAQMFVVDWQMIVRSVIKAFEKTTASKFDMTKSLLTQQTAKLSCFCKNEVVKRHCILAFNVAGKGFYEDLNTGSRVVGVEEEQVLEFLTSGVGYLLPQSLNAGIVLTTKTKLFAYAHDERLIVLESSHLNDPNFVLLLEGYMKAGGPQCSLNYCLDGDDGEIFLADEGRTGSATPDMVRTFLVIFDCGKLPRIDIPSNRKLLLYKRYAYDVRVEDGVVKKYGCPASERWGSRWLRLRASDDLHQCVSISVTGPACPDPPHVTGFTHYLDPNMPWYCGPFMP